MEKEAILHLLDENEMNEESKRLCASLFSVLRTGGQDDELLLLLGSKDYKRLENKVKEIYSDYFDLRPFMAAFASEEEEASAFRELYLNPIVSFTPKKFDARCKKYGKDLYLAAAIALNRISDEAISKNYSEEAFHDVLTEKYDLPEMVAQSLSEVYRDNYSRLAMGNIMRWISDLEESE